MIRGDSYSEEAAAGTGAGRAHRSLRAAASSRPANQCSMTCGFSFMFLIQPRPFQLIFFSLQPQSTKLHRVRPDGTCECRRRVTCAMDDAWWKSSRHRMSQETVTGRFLPPARPEAVSGGRVE
ncbi:hypothetical protein EVAR_86710_1 [Eumeta japonica]|uniref:Uncharacterized protein n=1 Tax=Eumeta variegata TaxID=151549 RepID=A0A4C1ZE36_EUMVA|nr:hypothetical protein EVAR_86710_1 [Eumeta japonica]